MNSMWGSQASLAYISASNTTYITKTLTQINQKVITIKLLLLGLFNIIWNPNLLIVYCINPLGKSRYISAFRLKGYR